MNFRHVFFGPPGMFEVKNQDIITTTLNWFLSIRYCILNLHVFTCLKSTGKTPGQCVKSVSS